MEPPVNEAQRYPILYSFRRCPYAMRARIVLRLCKIQCELREVVLRDKPKSMLEASAKGTVPVMILMDGSVIDESLDIMQWALSQRPGFDEDGLVAGWHAQSLRLIERNDGDFKHHLDRYKYPNRYDGVDRLQHRRQAETFLDELSQALANRRWLMGPYPSLADAAIGPFVRQFANAGRPWFDHSGHTHVQRWLASFLEWDGFTQVMQKYHQWTPGSDITLFPACP